MKQIYTVVHLYDIGSSHPEVDVSIHLTLNDAQVRVGQLTDEAIENAEVGLEYGETADGWLSVDSPEAEEQIRDEAYVRIDLHNLP